MALLQEARDEPSYQGAEAGPKATGAVARALLFTPRQQGLAHHEARSALRRLIANHSW